MGVMTVTATDRTIDRRRDRAGAAGAAAEQAAAAVTDIDNQLKTLADLTEQQHQSLRHAVDEAARLKQSLKAARKRRTELLKAREKAAARAEKARARAEAAESKYDKELLADLIRREKERDRAGSATPPQAQTRSDTTPPAQAETPPPAPAVTPPPAPDAITPPAKTPARRTRRPATDPPPERETASTATARRTAARKTARS